MSDIQLDPRMYPQTEQQTQYGGFWIRVLAYAIDSLLVSFLLFPLAFVSSEVQTSVPADQWNLYPQPALVIPVYDTNKIMIIMALQLLAFIVVWLYFALMQSSRHQATVGKMALGLKVADDYGNRIGFGRATGRFFAKILSSILFIGFIMVAFTDRKRGLHDMLAGTLVVRT